MIRQTIEKNFQENIQYIKDEHSLLFQKLVAYENAIGNGYCKEKYELVYENEGFDIYDKNQNIYMYNKQSKLFVSEILKNVNRKKDHNVFVAFRSHLRPSLCAKEMSEIGKFVFFGVGNGEHIWQIHKKMSAKSYMIVEDDLELFRLSLMSISYYDLAKESKLFFAILDDEDEFRESVKSFLEHNFWHNNYIKFLQLPNSNSKKMELFHLHVTTQPHLNFGYKSILEQYNAPLWFLRHKYNFLNLTKAVLPQKPTILLAPGPSLVKNIKWLKQHHKHFILVALSAVLPILQQHQIIPDIVTHVDGFQRSKKHFDNAKDILLHPIYLLSAMVPKSIVGMLKKDRIFLFESSTSYKQNFGSISAFCAGSSTYLMLLALGVKKLYLLGLDLAVDSKTLQTHSDGYAYVLKTEKTKDTMSFRDSLVEVKGNFSDTVKTTPNFSVSINAINEITTGFKKDDVEVYNLNDGAFFKHIKPLHVEDIDINEDLKKRDIDVEVIENFLQNSQQGLSESEKKSVSNSIIWAENIKKFIKKEFKKIYDIPRLYEKLQTNKDETISIVLTNCLFSIAPEVYECANRDDLLHVEIEQELLELLDRYTKALDG